MRTGTMFPSLMLASTAANIKANAGLIFNPSRLSQLSPPRQALVRLFQSLNFGQVQNLEIRNCEPTFNPQPSVLIDIKLDLDETPRPESMLDDFVLCAEICRLLAKFDEVKNGTIERIEIRAGIPRRLILRARLQEERP
jgi:hypothetical protein